MEDLVVDGITDKKDAQQRAILVFFYFFKFISFNPLSLRQVWAKNYNTLLLSFLRTFDRNQAQLMNW